MATAFHWTELLLRSYNRQCPDCRRALSAITEREAIAILAEQVNRAANQRTYSRTKLNNAIAIWQSASKRANAGKSARKDGERG